MRPKRRAMTEGSWFTAARTKLRVALMAQALALGCASSEESSELGEPVAQQASELAASTTLPQALSGKIQPITNAPGGVISAGIRGEPAVGHDGSANYRIPIGVPDGIDGLSPRLAIEYNSEAGQGILGPRFALAGLSVITRCAKTRAKDGAAGGIDFFGSTFCLDGEPLVMMSSTSTSAEFRAERNSFRKIVGTKNSLGDFVRFQVFEPDGRIGSYGASSSSRLHGNPVRFAGGTERDVTYAYHIDSISDRYSNQIRFTYKNVNSATTGKTRVQELVPDRISWGDSRQLRVMLFGYEGIPGGASINPQQRSIRGLEIGRGQYLQTISINGPDGVTSSSTALLKVYFFDYATSSRTGGPTIVTGRRVLRGIRECDGNSVCKKPTSIEWEAGSPDFVRTDLAISDFHTPDQTGFPMDPNFPQPWPPTTYKKYARFLVADMNRDGMDDIVYRGYLAPHHSGEQDCLGWIVRLASRAPGSSGAPKYDYVVPLSTLGGDPDWTCRAWIVSPTHYRDWAGSSPNLTGGIAYPGDLILADLDGDDYTDIISAISKNASTPTSRIINVFGYRAYLNSTIVGGGALTFMSPVNFLVSAASDVRPNGIELAPPGSGVLPLTNALLALGDIDGNGISEVIEPSKLIPTALEAKEISTVGVTQRTDTFNGLTFPYYSISGNAGVPLSPFSDGTNTFSDVFTLDLDGDGAAEVLRRHAQPGKSEVSVVSPTLKGTMNLPPVDFTPLFLDLNGDGLQDIFSVGSTDSSGEGYTSVGFSLRISNGQGFDTAKAVSWKSGCWAHGASARKLDFNLDGWDDVLIFAQLVPGPIGPSQGCTGGEGRKMWVLVSDGAGGFVARDPGLPASFAMNTTTATADLNGDGLTDFVQDENGRAIAYVRQGRAPELVTAINEGGGVAIRFDHSVANGADPEFYTSTPASTCNLDPKRLECLMRGRWLVSSFSIQTLESELFQTFRYVGGVSDKHGRGFLGFRERRVFGPGSQQMVLTYNPTWRLQLANGGGYVYPGALQPQNVRTEFDTADLTNPHRTEYESGPALPVDRLDKTYSMQIFGRERWTRDCPSADATGTCGAAGSRNMGAQSESFVYDGYGNVTESVARFRDENNVEMASQTENRYFAPDEGKWLLSLPDPARSNTLTSTSASPAQSVTRTTKLGADPTTGALTSIEIEPSGDGSLHSKRSFGRNGKGQITSVTDQDFAGSPVRTTSFLYEDSDGVYVTTVIDAKGFRTRIWRHPGLGLVVEVDDPNGLASTYSYDTLGRPLTRTNPSGETIRFAYFDGPADGTDFGVYPDASSGSYVSIHLDALGQEIKRDTPVGPGKSLLTEQELDERGRVVTSFLSSWNGTTRTDLNQEYFYYDDLNRVTASGGKVSDGTFRWRYYQYDGFSATEYDQAGRSSTVVTDALGRRTVQRAVLASGQSDALFSYGAFGLLVQQRTSDQTGRTDFGYDVLGRPTAITRTDTATRRATFNAFGDQVGAYKQLDGGGAVDNLVYGRDVLGRLTSVTGSNVNRSFSWDAPASSPGTPAPNAKLKLVDVIDGTNTGVHFDYGSNGFVRTKTWSAAVSSTLTEIGTAQFDYDGQGRLAKLTYPKVGAWSNPLAVTYDYDPYTGNVRSLSDAAVPGRAIWAVTATSERGQPVRELMDLPGGPTIARESTYYPQTGLIQTASISSTNGAGTTSFQSMGYQYDAGGLPSYRQRTGPGGNFREWFEHDNLGRLIHWIPGQCCGGSIDVNVYYDYDSDGNLTSRSWDSLEGTGLTTYTKLTGRFTDHPVRVQTSINGTLDSSQTYYYDKWGRLYGTPVAVLDYNAADEVIGIREINDPGSGGGSGGVTGPYDTIRRDGFGRRLVTSYADLSNQITATLYTFDDLAEIRSSSAGTEERCRLTANGKLVGELVRSSNTSTRTGTFYLADNVGSVVAEASSAGVVTPRARRDPFGNLIANPLAPHLPRDPTAANQDGSGRMAFAGHARDNNWGLVDMGARFYSPRLGRFAAPDPIVSEPFDRRAHNPFAYVWNSPVARRDPDGREGQPCPEGETCDDGSWELCPGGCWETTKHAAGAAKDGVVDFFGWLFGGGSSQPSTPQFRVVAPNNIVSSPQVSSNAMATTGKRGGTGGTTETNRTCEPKNPAPDLRDDGLDAFGRWIGYTAAHTDVNLAWPITFGRQGFVGGNPFSLSLHLLDESPIFTNLGSPPVIGAYKLRGLELLRGVDRALPTVLTGLNWFDAIDARQQGDSSKEMRFFLEGAFGLAASKAGILGGVMGFIWLDAKLSLWNVKNNMERAKEGREPIFYPSYPMAAPWAPMNPQPFSVTTGKFSRRAPRRHEIGRRAGTRSAARRFFDGSSSTEPGVSRHCMRPHAKCRQRHDAHSRLFIRYSASGRGLLVIPRLRRLLGRTFVDRQE